MHLGTEVIAVACFLSARQYTIPFPVLSETSRAGSPKWRACLQAQTLDRNPYKNVFLVLIKMAVFQRKYSHGNSPEGKLFIFIQMTKQANPRLILSSHRPA